ncbi:MAG: hypothetical protein LBD75_06710 [Candidatus Peribacteria bacterium]|nr:hypothetical protein [Candidatus Peribacteria bacterium]
MRTEYDMSLNDIDLFTNGGAKEILDEDNILVKIMDKEGNEFESKVVLGTNEDLYDVVEFATSK